LVGHSRKLDLHYGTTILVIIAILTNNINFSVGFEVSPISLMAVFSVVLINFSRIKNDVLSGWLIRIFFFSSMVTFMFLSPMDYLKDTIFVMILLSGFTIAQNERVTLFIINLTIILLFVFCILQFIPGYENIHEVIFNRSSSGGSRGATSFLAEPSFLAATTAILMVNYGLLKEGVKFSDPFVLLLLFTMFASFSAMAVFGLVAFFYLLRWPLSWKVILTTVIGYLVWPLVSELNVRAAQVLFALIDGKSDQSSGARLFYVLKDLHMTKVSYFMPVWGLGGYSAASEYIDVSHLIPSKFIYDPKMSGSLFGRYIVIFGFTVLILPLYFIHKSNRRFLIKMLSCLLIIVLLSLQMIPLGLVPFVLFLGSSLSILYSRSRIY
jgi:hypothetical protein